jgi:hypothetical protein
VKSHINFLEARALLSYLQRIKLPPRTTVFVGTDSRVLLGAILKGRSSSKQLNHMLRLISGLCLVQSWILEVFWLQSEFNPSDAPTRNYSLEEWRAKLPSHEVASGIQIRGALGVPLTFVEALCEEVVRPMTCAPVSAPRGDEPAYIHMSAMPKRLPGTVAPLLRAMLHVFAGQDGLTLAFCKLGGDCFRGWDIIGVIDCIDLRTAAGKIRLLEACADPRVVYSAFGPPCGSFCRVYVNYTKARGTGSQCPALPEGSSTFEKEVLGNYFAELVAEGVSLLGRLGRLWSVEQPWGSYMFKLACFTRLRSLRNFLIVLFDQCMYGLRVLVDDGCPQPGGCFHRKRTELWTNFTALEGLRRTCTRTHEHIELQGQVIRCGRRVARTHLAATYPPELCEAWAGLSFASGELGAEGSRQPVSFLSQ